jgi:hypothetical protein
MWAALSAPPPPPPPITPTYALPADNWPWAIPEIVVTDEEEE